MFFVLFSTCWQIGVCCFHGDGEFPFVAELMYTFDVIPAIDSKTSSISKSTIGMFSAFFANIRNSV